MKYIFVFVLMLYFGSPIKAQVLSSCEPKNVSSILQKAYAYDFYTLMLM